MQWCTDPPQTQASPKLEPLSPKNFYPHPPSPLISPGIFYPAPLNYSSTGGKKHENVNLIQKPIQCN